MKIRVSYGFYTDGDFSLRDKTKFGCTGVNVRLGSILYDYTGDICFEEKEPWKCKCAAKTFLEWLLCDGISVSYTHHYLIKDLYDIIESLIDFIDSYDIGEEIRELSGNYEGTFIKVTFVD